MDISVAVQLIFPISTGTQRLCKPLVLLLRLSSKVDGMNRISDEASHIYARNGNFDFARKTITDFISYRVLTELQIHLLRKY